MAIRYTPDDLKRLRESPLVAKPPGLPPAEQWMGPLTENNGRNPTKQADRSRNNDSNPLLDQTNRRPGVERHISRNSASKAKPSNTPVYKTKRAIDPEDIILGPPKTSFLSATSMRNAGKSLDPPDRTTLRDLDRDRDRFNFRPKTGDGENDRNREGRNTGLRPKRAEGEDSDGWSTVKPRKSFGAEGAERFNGRMGVGRDRDDRRFKDREERDSRDTRDTRDRPRGFESYSREKEGDPDQDRDHRRNGATRGRNEPSWFKDRENKDEAPTPKDRNSNGDRYMDRSRGWRDKEPDDRFDRGERIDRGDRRWGDRDQRQEREPEWMDEPAEEKSQQRTAEDFQRWKDQMRGKDKDNTMNTPADDKFKPDTGASFFGLSKEKVETPLEIEAGPDKFFGMWAAPREEPGPDANVEAKKEVIPKARTVGKASRFTSFFAAPEEPQRRQTEPPPPMPPIPQGGEGGLASLFANGGQSSAEKEAFQQLLAKLQRQTISPAGSTPPANISLQPKPPGPERQPSSTGMPLDMYQQMYQQPRSDRQEEGRPSTRNSQQHLHELLNQRQMTGSQPAIRSEQILQDLVGQRQNASSQASSRPDQPPSRNNNTEFLMGLMQSAKSAPAPQRTEEALLRMPPPKSMDRQMQQQMMEREQEMQREAVQRERQNSASQRQVRPQAPPGFFDEPRGPQDHSRQPAPQPTQILQRPQPPPGLEFGWDGRGQPQLAPQHRLVAPPPGLQGGITRGMPMPQQMFPPGYPMGPGSFPPQELMNGPPRNVGMAPPPGFPSFGPPGFMPPPGMGGFPGQDFGVPFDGRGAPGFRRQ